LLTTTYDYTHDCIYIPAQELKHSTAYKFVGS
jgi:hypothetical protein